MPGERRDQLCEQENQLVIIARKIGAGGCRTLEKKSRLAGKRVHDRRLGLDEGGQVVKGGETKVLGRWTSMVTAVDDL